ncbi:hypothetical protein PR202_ga30748 [Eleusine coracana subsp. coracana]|uniref:DUF676 domain-containing protein n=1 Tax=Eleusine coracana subsp. coracana TaxID=191504 RepID=A0AAV5DQ42_ELECO|nr:hypothetical protein PR202_ga30748 [Eleusine coracana subsp. coracana]
MGGEDAAAAVCAEESASGGVDVWSDAVESHAPDHLLVMVHGILGSFAGAAAISLKLLFYRGNLDCSEKNASLLTLDGVDVMGERLADEVLDVISRKPELTKISFLAHSVGGVAARYAIAKLYRHPNDASDGKGKTKGTIWGLEAVNFITVATPHLGSRGNKQWVESLSQKYPHIVHEEYSEEINDDKCHDSMKDCDLDILEEKMVTGLGRVSWEKVDVSFHTSMTSFAAHSIIQVKYAFMNEGADVIQHIIDHFQV